MVVETVPAPRIESQTKLPRLAFVSDVPVEQTAAGALMTYRLLCDYDTDRLLVINGNFTPHDPKKRLPGVAWRSIAYAPTRLYQTRLNGWLAPLLTKWVQWHSWQLARQLKDWGAEAVLTIPQLYLWLAAAAAARRLRLPLHLILHDDWPSITPGLPLVTGYYHRTFGRLYRAAASRLCVCREMADYYDERYKAPATVLYPTRGNDSAVPRIRVRSRRGAEPLVVAYAGSLWGGGYVQMLQTVAVALQEIGGRLDVYNDATQADLVRMGLSAANIKACGFPPLNQAADRIGATADVMFLPVSFLAKERGAVRLNFPSKLVEYTAFGLPLLIWAPPEHSSVRWAVEYGGAAEVVTEFDSQKMRAALARLAADENLRRVLATKAAAAGDRCFRLEHGQGILYDALRSASASRGS